MFDQKFWDRYYRDQDIPWDMGHVSPPLKAYIDQLENKAIRILIPGAGNGHEAEYLWQQGFHNIFILDISKLPLKNLQRRVPEIPQERFILQDFFEHRGSYDLILEQTFFCALSPSLREKYVRQMYRLLAAGGKLAGLLFTFPLNPDQEKPPFGGSLEEYQTLFARHFKDIRIETAYNSHPARSSQEAFFILRKH